MNRRELVTQLITLLNNSSVFLLKFGMRVLDLGEEHLLSISLLGKDSVFLLKFGMRVLDLGEEHLLSISLLGKDLEGVVQPLFQH